MNPSLTSVVADASAESPEFKVADGSTVDGGAKSDSVVATGSRCIAATVAP